MVIAGYEPISSDELQLSVDDLVLNVRRVTDDKMEGYLRGHKGKFPAQNVYVSISYAPINIKLIGGLTPSHSSQLINFQLIDELLLIYQLSMYCDCFIVLSSSIFNHFTSYYW